MCVLNPLFWSVLLSGRRKSKQALRDYKKVQIQLENLETSVRDRCKKEFTGWGAEQNYELLEFLEMTQRGLTLF